MADISADSTLKSFVDSIAESDSMAQSGSIAQSESTMGQMLTLLLEHVGSLICVFNKRHEVLYASTQHFELHGVTQESAGPAEKSYVFSYFPPVVHDRLKLVLEDLNRGAESLGRWEMTVKHKNGTPLSYLVKTFKIRSQKYDDCWIFIGNLKIESPDIEKTLRDHQSQLTYLTFHDPLTGLANRSLFYDRMDKSISRAKRSKNNLALLLVDLDRFKIINENLGTDAGDQYLKKVSEQLKQVLRDTDTIARLGGDEFVIVLENIRDAENIEQIAKKILVVLAKPIVVEETELSSTASIGISLFPKDGDSTDKLLRHADIAMYRAKSAGKNQYQFFLKAMTDSAVNYLLLENDLRKAIENNELILHYQPQIDLSTNHIVGLEALVRWQHSERGIVPPMDFIPLAEETGLIEPLGEWVLMEACQKFSKWLKAGINFGKIAVNLSARQFRLDGFEQLVGHVLRESGLPSRYLELEITETSIMENAAKTVSVLNELNNMGLSLAIDDFGTGYSSLAYLKRFPIHKLKVDRSFIKDIDEDENDAAIAKSIIDLGHNMSLEVIAEGVERQSQTSWLTDRGCDQVQGYFFSRPLSEDQLLELAKHKVTLADGTQAIILKIGQ